MIPHQFALVFWIPISIFLMMDRDNARGFTIAFLGGFLLLPELYGLELPGVPDITKTNVAAIGILIGTLFFHPEVFDRFRVTVADVFLLVAIECAFVTEYLNDHGAYDGVSQSFEFMLDFALPVFLGRLHLGTPRSLRTFLIGIVLGSVCYVPLALWEFRMSPQIHTTVYGYFQHVFQQHYRAGHWRPIVFLAHALDLGRFFAFAAFLALFPLRKDLTELSQQYLGRSWGRYTFVAPLGGLLLSMSYGPYMLFVLLCGCYLALVRRVWLGYLIPAVGFIWVALLFAGFGFGYDTVNKVAIFNPDRAQSLEYRLIAMQEYRSVILHRPWFGYGGWGGGRIEGRATDSQLLIALLARGLIGTLAEMGWWLLVLHSGLRALWRTRGTVLNRRIRAVIALLSIALLIICIDAAITDYLIVAAAGMAAIGAWLETNPAILTRVPRPGQTAPSNRRATVRPNTRSRMGEGGGR